MKKSKDYYILQIVSYVLVSIVAIFCLIPFVLIISASFSKESEIMKYGFSFLPRQFTLESYILIFKNPALIFQSYKVSLIVTISGAVVGLFFSAMTAFVIMRKDFKYRNVFAFGFYFSTIFSGGLIPHYILIANYLNWKDSLLALIVPGLLSAWNIFLLRNFMSSIPYTIAESAKIDGANDFYIFIKLYLPLSTAGLATVGLFQGLSYWNAWFPASLYIDKASLYPLQYLLYKMLGSIKAIQDAANSGISIPGDMPSETLKMAMAMVATGPIILLYPFVQKYFVKGITIGAVKG